MWVDLCVRLDAVGVCSLGYLLKVKSSRYGTVLPLFCEIGSQRNRKPEPRVLRAVLAEKAHATRQAAAARSLAASVCVCLPIYRSKPVNVGTWGLDSLPLTLGPDDTRARPHSRVIDGTHMEFAER